MSKHTPGPCDHISHAPGMPPICGACDLGPCKRNAQWRTETRYIGGKRVTFVLRGYGGSAEYMRHESGLPVQFNAATARAAIAKAEGTS